jgi:hypothetical protein
MAVRTQYITVELDEIEAGFSLASFVLEGVRVFQQKFLYTLIGLVTIALADFVPYSLSEALAELVECFEKLGVRHGNPPDRISLLCDGLLSLK